MGRGRKPGLGERERGFLLGVAERGRDSVGGRCGLIVIGKAPRVFQLFPIRCTRVREQVTRKLTPLLPIVIAFRDTQNCVTHGVKPVSTYALEIEDCELKIRIQSIR